LILPSHGGAPQLAAKKAGREMVRPASDER
jgi:hypothetical protein